MIKKAYRFNRPLRRMGTIALTAALMLGSAAQLSIASDHDDGETDIKGRNLNLTDLYVFRDGDQNPKASTDDLVLIMNTNPRSVARQQYYFSTQARYEFNISRAADNDATPTGKPDVKIRFRFGKPNAQNQQEMKMTVIRDGRRFVTTSLTTPLDAAPNVKTMNVGGAPFSVFAGLREDPFFFDVEQFFRVRAGARGDGPAVGFRSPDKAVDFATGYNVNAIAVRVPIKFLQDKTKATTFDVWETISIPEGGHHVKGKGKGQRRIFKQVERLARPGINEGLIVQNDFLNALNSVGPDFEAAALAGQPQAAKIAGPIIADASKTLQAIGNDEKRTQALLTAFLPDVMRIDTTDKSGYGNALNSKGSPIRGRLIEDDVIDTTLSVLTNGAITTDNVSYAGTPGNPSQGHDPLLPKFPYLALPN